MSWFSNLKKKVVTLFEARDPNKVYWDPEIMKRLEKLRQVLNKAQKKKWPRSKELGSALNDVVKLLQKLCFVYPERKAQLQTVQLFNECMLVMLNGLKHLNMGDRYNVYKGVGYLCRRTEFGTGLLALEEGSSLSVACTPEELEEAYRYRKGFSEVLGALQEFLVGIDEAERKEAAKAETKEEEEEDMLLEKAPSARDRKAKKGGAMRTSFIVLSFSAQVLAVASFRIPGVLQACCEGLQFEVHEVSPLLDDVMDQARLVASKGPVSHSKQLASIGKSNLFGKIPVAAAEFYLSPFGEESLEAPAELRAAFPCLFDWVRFHDALDKTGKGKKINAIDSLGPDWQRHLKHDSNLFSLFFKYYIEHVTLVKDHLGKPLSWRAIPGFRTLARAYLIDMCTMTREQERHDRDCATALLVAEPSLLDFYVKRIFLVTNAHDPSSVLDTLARLEDWLKALSKVRAVVDTHMFDFRFFCAGIERILAQEHHMAIGKIMSLLFNYHDVFSPEGRSFVYGTLLIQQHGFKLFLHWDTNIRSSFHQLVAFRLTLMKRSDIRSATGAATLPASFESDRALLSQQDALLKTVRKHKVGEENDDAITFLQEAYVERAIDEFDMWLGKYAEWEKEASSELPKLAMVQKQPSLKV